jgi:hypothetical protein
VGLTLVLSSFVPENPFWMSGSFSLITTLLYDTDFVLELQQSSEQTAISSCHCAVYTKQGFEGSQDSRPKGNYRKKI